VAKILLVEDEEELRGGMLELLSAQNYLVDAAEDGMKALELLAINDYDVIILDWNVPHMTGPEICRKYRNGGGKAAVIMLTGNRTVDHKETGLDAGADDYLTKPVHHRELLAQVRASLRRTSGFSDVLKTGGLVLDPGKHSVTLNDENVDLLPKEFALLEFLMRHPNTVFSPEALMERVWPSDSETSPDMIRKYVSRLREKIDKKGSDSSYIRTVHGVGYRFDKKD
jgi:DNA-binding response OmpR family regulator